MAISFAEATRCLLGGKPLAWGAFEEHKAASLILAKPGQRRLFAFLLAQDRAKVASGDEELFAGLIAAWNSSGVDPAADGTTETPKSSKDVWRLDRIEASGFGGLTLFGSPPFDFRIGGENWCLNGQNGSGKTSLASAILWALTGKRIREQEGPVDEHGERAAVINETGKKLGDWPSFASYPSSAADLTKPVNVWVRLTFVNQQGEIATAYRQMQCPLKDDPKSEVMIDSRLLAAPELLETGLLMPARLARIGFGDKSGSLYEAVKMLTGLDQLADIADGCAQFTHGGRRFLKYGKDKGLERWAAKFTEEIAKAVEKASELRFVLPDKRSLGDKTLVTDLKEAAVSAATEAGTHLETLKSQISPTIDTSTIAGRTTVRDGVASARAIVNQGTKGIVLFEAWIALKAAKEDEAFAGLPAAIDAARARLDRALSWHAQQNADQKFRLKALAAQFYVPPQEHSVPAQCPLCSARLSTAEQQDLAVRLAQLQKDAAEAERKLDDVCRGLEAELVERLPAELKRHRDFLVTMEPKTGYGAAIRERFCEGIPFTNVLLGLAGRIKSRVDLQEAALPTFAFATFEPAEDEPEPAIILRRSLHNLERLSALVEWWSEHRGAYRQAWSEVIGQVQEDGTYPADSVEGQLRALEDALSKAEPLDALSKFLLEAVASASNWDTIRKEQDLREAIAEALEPLKHLRLLVSAETARSIANLSIRIKDILGRIHLKERLTYEQTSLGKKVVHVGGSFETGMQIDAALVANTSWLRAILWAFILALREETIEGLGANPFPLMVLDDPQMSFDPRNKRKWAEEITRLANMDRTVAKGLQLFLTTHERQFYQCIVDVERLKGEQGLIGGVNKTSGVATIVNAGWLQRAWQNASENNDDALARDYIADVRIYCEDLLKFMLRAEGPAIPNLSLDGLKHELKRLHDAHVAPFNRKAFADLLKTLMGGGGKPMKLINEVHHKDDESIGLAEARDVNAFWEKTFMNQIHDAFAVYDAFESFYGEPRTFPWAKTVIPFPGGFREDVKTVTLQKTGIAAAAKTGSRAGDGVVTVKEWETTTAITLTNHEIYQLAAGTLDPVAAIGDLVIVCNHAKVNPRDLVVAAHGNALLARRYNEMEAHPEIAVLTGQSVDPCALPEPLIIGREQANLRKIVGTLFAAHRFAVPALDPNAEVVALKDSSVPQQMLNGARLFEVQGRSAEPIALEGQFLITREAVTTIEQIKSFDSRPIVAVDEDGTRYFKRLRCRGDLAVLESLNPDGTTAAELLGFTGAEGLPKLTHALEVIGVLFELPHS
ncbi:MAG: ATP-binding protein [Nitrospirota bacterium]|nr:ATP-binding protein [Nitrospirota bacterium]